MKPTREEMFNLSIEVAGKIIKDGYNKDGLESMTQETMSKYDNRIGEMPASMSMYDGKDYEEDDCFDYFKALVRFQFVCLKRKMVNEIKVIIPDPNNGSDEAVWVKVDDATFADYKARKSGGRYKAILDNDPLNIDKMHGDEITITLRGEENLMPIMTEDDQ